MAAAWRQAAWVPRQGRWRRRGEMTGTMHVAAF